MAVTEEILVDVDEVLGDWQTPCLDIAERVSGKRYNVAEMAHWDILAYMDKAETAAVLAEMARPGFAYEMQPKPGAQDFIRELKKLGDVRILTAQFFKSPTWTYDRNRWLYELFGIPPDHVTFTHQKQSHHGRVLIDDKPENILKWETRWPEELPILWHIPNTSFFKYEGLRAHTWDQVLAAVESHLHK